MGSMTYLILVVLELYHVRQEKLTVCRAQEVALRREHGHEVVVVLYASRPHLLIVHKRTRIPVTQRRPIGVITLRFEMRFFEYGRSSYCSQRVPSKIRPGDG